MSATIVHASPIEEFGWVMIHGHPVLIGAGGGGGGAGGARKDSSPGGATSLAPPADAGYRQAYTAYNRARARDSAGTGEAHAATLRAAADLHAAQRERADANQPVPMMTTKVRDRLAAHVAEHAAIDPAHPAHAIPEQREFAQTDEGGDWAHARYRDWAAKLPDAQHRALQMYQGYGYGPMNRLLRHGKATPDDRPLPPLELKRARTVEMDAARAVRGVDKALETAPPLERPTTVYRGMGMRDEMWDTLRPGAILHDKGYVSTSIDRAKGDEFARNGAFGGKHGVQISITVPKGTRAAYMEHMYTRGERSSEHKMGEYELLLPRDRRFRVTKSEIDAGGQRRLEMEMLP